MAVFNDRVRSFIKGLSDFWLVYFEEVDQLEVFYRGTEILIGQTYLDLMSLLLNNSLQDTTIFNKEFFKLLQINETDVVFRQSTAPENDRYVLTLPDDIVFARHLNNKILDATAGLDKDVDYYIDDEARALDFLFDPTNAYRELTFGELNSQFRVRSNLITGEDIRIHLNDTGGALSITRVGFDITIAYDGPASTGTTSATEIVAELNTNLQTSTLLFSEVTGLGTGTASPAGNAGLTSLAKVSASALDNFATRSIELAFASRLQDNTIGNWVTAGVEKGDVLRFIAGQAVGESVETPISLVRSDALYQNVGGETVAFSTDKVNFAVLREPENPVSLKEPFVSSGAIVQSGVDGTITAATQEFSSPTALFSPVHEGDVIEVAGVSNLGNFRILSVTSPSTAVIAIPGAVDETPISWALRTVVDPTNIGTDGVLTNNLDGTASFTAASATFDSLDAGKVLKIFRGSSIETYDITAYISATEITLAVAATVVDGAALDWGLANQLTPPQVVVYSPPIGWIKPGSVSVDARRLVDNQIVQQGRDYEVDIDASTITPITVWRTSTTNTTTYSYRLAVVENTTPLQSGVDGTLTSGSPNTFSAPTAAFTEAHVGYAINVGGSGLSGATNNGLHFIAAVTSATTVELTNDKNVPTTADPNNGSLTWSLLRRGVLATEDVTAFVTETAFWIPDALVDRFHLYNTFGYLINRFERSSEAYRSLIRGIFQLFMLGPTLERFESAINTVAGLEVIRDNGEILVSYDTNEVQSGVDGFFDFTTRTFTSATATFTANSVSDYIFATSGANENKLFLITAVVDANTVTLATAPSTEGPVSWEHTVNAEHTVTTSRRVYTFPRQVPIRERIRDSANFGAIVFSAFEVLTDVFQVTDYVEDPNWFDFVQIPAELMPEESASRRQSTPVLFENVVGPADEGRIGDPGFIIGADSEGFIAPSVFLRDDAGAADGTITGDSGYPFSNVVVFTSPTGAFSSVDLGNLLVIDPGGPAEAGYRIRVINSATEIELESFVDVEDATGLSWEIQSLPLAKRHKAAFVILNNYLKYHLFSVNFDASLLGQASSALLTDLQELVLVAKPTYTYAVVSPSALFNEIINIEETFELEPTLNLGGGAGTIIAANASPLLVIGSSWRIGSWFRYLDNTSTFSAPAASVSTALGAVDAGYQHVINKVYIDPTDFTSGSDPIQVAAPVRGFAEAVGGVGDLALSVSGSEVTATVTSAPFLDIDLLGLLRVSGSAFGNNGYYTIGQVVNASTVIIVGPSISPETNLDWEIHNTGGVQGQVRTTSRGQVEFKDSAARHIFNAVHEGDYLRRPYVTHLTNQVFEVDTVSATDRVKIASRNRVDPIEGSADLTGTIAGNVMTVTPGDVVFSKSMAAVNRLATDASTAEQKRFYVNFSSGSDSGNSFLIQEYLSPSSIRLAGLTHTGDADFNITVITAPDVVTETSNWEHVREQIVIDGDSIDLSNTPTQDVNASVSYTAYGVREPIDPSLETFDDTAGDTLYSIGMPDPRQKRGKSRTGKETDMREEPIEITRTV